MASAPGQGLPLFYNGLEPLSSGKHGDWTLKTAEKASFFAQANVVPLTSDEFVFAQRHYPIVFSVGDDPVPLALMGLNEGVNVFVEKDGALRGEVYVPAYVRRYPFMLVKMRPDAEELSLCFDPASEVISQDADGKRLFEDGQPSDVTREILAFCESFEQAGQRTSAFIGELKQAKLLMDGELAIEVPGQPQPFVYRGFQMVNEEALKELRGDVARRMVQSGAMALIYAHLFSLSLSREVFARQMALGEVPTPTLTPAMA